METMTVSKEYIKKEYKNYVKDTNKKISLKAFANILICHYILMYGITKNPYFKTQDTKEIAKEIVKVLKEV